MTRMGWLGGVMLFVAACSGGAAATSSSGTDAGGRDGAGTSDGPALEDAAPADGATGFDASSHDGSTKDAGGNSDSGKPADAGIADTATFDGNWTIAVPSDIPQVQNNGAPDIKTPVFQSISFSGYDQAAQIDDFVATVGSTPYWQSAVAEYGVGVPTVQPPVHLTATAPKSIDDTAIQSWLATEVSAGVGLMAPSANALYIISYPATTTVTLDNSPSCTSFGAYHNSAAVGGIQVAYAVLPECTYAPSTTLQSSTDSLSHELAEATTDPVPIPFTSASWQGTDPAHTFWEVITGGDGELGDMCSFFYNSFYTPPSYTYDVQRIWSNAAALAGHDPCQPELPGEVYFTAVPLMTDMVPILWDGQSGYDTEGVQIAEGASKTIPVQLYSEGPTPAWTVSAVEYSPITNAPKHLAFAWDKTKGQNGDTLHLTITVSGTDATYDGNAFILYSSSGNEDNMWLGFVGR